MPSTLIAIAAAALHAPASTTTQDRFAAEDIVVVFSCAAACNDTTPPTPDNPMCFSYRLNEPGGWPRFMSTEIWDDYQDGYRRFLLHLPFGSEWGNGAMDLDQPLDSIEAGEAHVLHDFTDALEWALDYMPDAEFIAYVGRSETDLHETLTNDNRLHDHWQRLSGAGWNMVLLDYPNVSVAFDAGTDYRNGVDNAWAPGDVYFQFIKLIEAYKLRQRRHVYIEAIPRNTLTPNVGDAEGVQWQRTMPWIAWEDAYLNQIGRWWNYDPPLQSPEGIRCLTRAQDLEPWLDRGGSIAWAANCISHGHTPAINRNNPMFPWHQLTAQEAFVVMTRNLD
ncbi:MAG: hypothetical protein RIB32_01690 [Phycisphaerales bacterium]